MREPATPEVIQQVRLVYMNIERLLQERGLQWQELAEYIGISPKTMSSMKAQNRNPSIVTVKKIAEALEVSIDEIVSDGSKSNSIYDLEWILTRLFPLEKQPLVCKQLMTTALIISDKVEDWDVMTLQQKRYQVSCDSFHAKLRSKKAKAN